MSWAKEGALRRCAVLWDRVQPCERPARLATCGCQRLHTDTKVCKLPHRASRTALRSRSARSTSCAPSPRTSRRTSISPPSGGSGTPSHVLRAWRRASRQSAALRHERARASVRLARSVLVRSRRLVRVSADDRLQASAIAGDRRRLRSLFVPSDSLSRSRLSFGAPLRSPRRAQGRSRRGRRRPCSQPRDGSGRPGSD